MYVPMYVYNKFKRVLNVYYIFFHSLYGMFILMIIIIKQIFIYGVFFLTKSRTLKHNNKKTLKTIYLLH